MEAVLDAACGNGFEAILFALHGTHVYANDISSARVAVTQARTRFYRSLLDDRFRVTVTSGNAIELAGSLPRFDVIYVQEAISHIHPAETFLREVATRLLTPSGRLIVSDSNSWNPVIRARISRQLWVERRTLRHFVEEQVDPETGRRYVMAEERLFSPPGISRAFHQAGLEVKQLSINGFAPPLLLRRPRSPFAMFVDDFAARIPGAQFRRCLHDRRHATGASTS